MTLGGCFMKTDAMDQALFLRNNLKINDDILVVDFTDTLQGIDTSKVLDLMPNIYTGEYVFRTKMSIKDIDPRAAFTYGKGFVDISNMSDSGIEDFVKRQEFDFPLWYKHHKDFKMRNVPDYNPPFILQVAGCNFHDGSQSGGCWYCFVDDTSNDGRISDGKTFLSIDETIDSMISARHKLNTEYKKSGIDLNLKVLRTSGGEPTIVLDWILDLWREVERRGLDFVGQIDSNLSTGHLIDRFENTGIFEQHTLEKLASYPIKVLTAIKGVDPVNLADNVQAITSMDEQKYSIKRFLKAGFDIYPQMYNPEPSTLQKYLADMDSHIENFSLRVHIGPIKMYSPNNKRLTLEAQRQQIDPAQFITDKETQWQSNYKNGCMEIDSYLMQRYGLGYKDSVRSDIKLKLLKD